MAEVTIYTASRSLQGKEVRGRFDSSFADVYHDLDGGFSPVNFMLPWAPFPHNKKRDAGRRRMEELYLDIINERRSATDEKQHEHDMITNLMSCTYKDGKPVPDLEVAHMMIALLMAGQHSSSSTISWCLLNLASRPDIIEELYEEQKRVLGSDLPPLSYESVQKLFLNSQVVKETLRIHAPIHSILRKVTTPLIVEGTPYVIPTSHVVLASPGVTQRATEHFPEPLLWEPHRWDADGHSLAAKTQDLAEEKEDYGYGMVSKGANSPYLPFGAGRHRCIGEQFAYVQLGTILAMFVREFRWKGAEGYKVPSTDYSVSCLLIPINVTSPNVMIQSLFSRPMSPAIIQWERREKS